MQDLLQLERDLTVLKKQVTDGISQVSTIKKELDEQQKALDVASESVSAAIGVEKETFKNFFKKPYEIVPITKNKVYVIVPKFIKNFYVGWLHKESESYYTYLVDQYSSWLGNIPQDILDQIEIKEEFKAEIIDNLINFQPGEKDKVRRAIGDHISSWGDGQAKIKQGHEFQVLVDMIERGNLPFRPRKVIQSDLREGRSEIILRSYQEPGYKEFMDKGAIGLFHPTGSGKSMITCKLIDVLKGRKRIVVPTRILVEQWEYYIEKYVPFAKSEVLIQTYQSYRKSDEEFMLTVFDECQRLPADTFSRIATSNTKYRIGLSAGPYREDGRASYIFALTGFPVGLNWANYMEESGREYHPIHVHVVKNQKEKIDKVMELFTVKKKTLIFSDGIELGKLISGKLGIPFVSGETKDGRLDIIYNTQSVVVSRVGDLGVSDKKLEHIIEVDFLGGSRSQQLQRTGRLLHSDAKVKHHDIIFTEQEVQDYGKRLWSLQEKGFTIKYIN